MVKQSTSYGLYTFQLVPIARNQQISLFDKELKPEELIRRKNEFFGEVLKLFPNLKSARHELVQKNVFVTKR
jgi:hypothetical protein